MWIISCDQQKSNQTKINKQEQNKKEKKISATNLELPLNHMFMGK